MAESSSVGSNEVGMESSVVTALCTHPDQCMEVTTEAGPALSKFFVTPFGFKVAYLIVGGLGMSGNLMTVVVILTSASLRATFTNKFIVNQSLIDFAASFFILATNMLNDPAPAGLGDGTAQTVYCMLWMTKWPMWGSFITSTMNLVALTFERYYAILFPLHHSHHFTTKKAYIIMALAWIFGFSLHASYGVTTTLRKDGACLTFQYPSQFIRRCVVVLTIVVQYLSPMLSIMYAYVHIFLALRKSPKGESLKTIQDPREDRMRKARKNVIKTLVKVFACFVLCWTPNQIFYIGMSFGYQFSPDATYYHITVLLVFVNSVINPVVYTLTYTQFQKGQLDLFCACCRNKDNTDTAPRSGQGVSSKRFDAVNAEPGASSCQADTSMSDTVSDGKAE